METFYLGIVVFLFVLAVFDLTVGVSNDAVNFLSSAIGTKTASFKLIITVAACGVFCGAIMSNGMMDIARHGIFHPVNFTFNEVMCIFLAEIVSDVVLLDIFNTLGLPTSTTVSMVFELLGGAFIISCIKLVSNPGTWTLGSLINTEKAFSVVLGIFLSVAIAFFFGILVQWIVRMIFTFNYKKNLNWIAGIFGGLAVTTLLYFMVLKGLMNAPFMQDSAKAWVDANTSTLIIVCFIATGVLMQVLHWCGVNIFRIIVLMGTFALAMAFAGNDLVNFIGVPLAGFSSYTDYVSNGSGEPTTFWMTSLEQSARTPFYFLLIAGCIMIVSLVTSKKAQNVVKTSVDLSRQDEGDEMFGSSEMARTLVRSSSNSMAFVVKIMPKPVLKWIDSRFNHEEAIMPQGAAFDLVRASVNLVLAGLLIIMGTSLKLPLSTTYVAFMVAMGSSLADRAWKRESAVFRITGMLNVVGGWFITAGAAFALSCCVATIMYFGGAIAMVAMVFLAIYLLIRSQIQYTKKMARQNSEQKDEIFHKLIHTDDKDEAWLLLRKHVEKENADVLGFIQDTYLKMINAFIKEDRRTLKHCISDADLERDRLKKLRRKDVVGLKYVESVEAIENTTWVFLGSSSAENILFSLRHIGDPCKEHLDNNFNPLPTAYVREFLPMRDKLVSYLQRGKQMIESGDYEGVDDLRKESDEYKNEMSLLRKKHIERMRKDDQTNMRISLLYLTILQESQEIAASFRHIVRACARLENKTKEI